MNKLNFTKATSKESELITQLVNRAYRGDSSKKGWTTEADFLDGQRTDAEKITEMIEKKENVILLAWDLQKIIGTVYLENKEKHLAYLGMLTVEPEIQAKGLGRKILQEAESFVKKEWNAKTIEMTVINIRTELIEWYQRRGYSPTNETRPFPIGDRRFGLPKVNNLQFIVLRKTLE